ncbi:MAG: hypothetical protein ABIQ99_09950 [Thermoflexales bacterium]
MKIAVGAAIATLMLGGVGVAYAQTGGPGKDPVTPQGASELQNAPANFGRGGMLNGLVKQIDGTTLVLTMPGMTPPQGVGPKFDRALPGQPNGRNDQKPNGQGNFKNQPPQGQPQQGAPGQGRKGQPQPEQAQPQLAQREVRVQTDASTKFYVPGKPAPTLADVKVGDRVAILLVAPSKPAEKADTGNVVAPTFLARAVAVIPLPQSVQLMGKAANVTAANFSLTGPNGFELGQVSIVPATKFVMAGDPAATISSLKNNDQVQVIGRPTGDKMVEAALIIDQPLTRTANFAGMVASVNGNTIILWQLNGQQLTVNAANAIFLKGMDITGTIADVRVGMPIRVIGAKTGDTVVAQVITGMPNMGGPDNMRPGLRR